MRSPTLLLPVMVALMSGGAVRGGQTSLSDKSIAYTVPTGQYVILQRGPVRAVIADNSAVDDAVLKGHRAGYAGVASLTHEKRPDNLFVPAYAGLNFEHIHDGTAQPNLVLYEPRNAPMELRVIDRHAVELYQKPTPHWGLESCQRFHLLEDGTIELTLECVAHRRSFRNGYIGLFWASYIDHPESTEIRFRGFPDGAAGEERSPRWVRAVSPAHGVEATHLGADDGRAFAHDENFPMKLVFNRSRWRFAEPWYFGASHGMAFAQLFRPADGVRFSQSPSGGGDRNPAWDFQFFIPDYEAGRIYRFIMRAAYVPATGEDEVRLLVEPRLRALATKSDGRR